LLLEDTFASVSEKKLVIFCLDILFRSRLIYTDIMTFGLV
jgi:hypothetical protein